MCEIPGLCAVTGVDNPFPPAQLQPEAAAGWDLSMVIEPGGQIESCFSLLALSGDTVLEPLNKVTRKYFLSMYQFHNAHPTKDFLPPC